MIGALVIALVVGFLGAPDTRGKTLEEIEEERYGRTQPSTGDRFSSISDSEPILTNPPTSNPLS